MLIKIKRETVKELKRLKFHPRETYDDVIKVLSEVWREQHIHGWGSSRLMDACGQLRQIMR